MYIIRIGSNSKRNQFIALKEKKQKKEEEEGEGRNTTYRNLKLIEANNLLSKLDVAEMEGKLEEITQNAAEKK